MHYRITKTCSSAKDFPICDDEELFFQKLYELLDDSQNQYIHLERLSDGAISVYFKLYPIGKIKLSGRKHWMQTLKGLYTVKVIEGSVNDFISQQTAWKNYIRLHCKY